VTEFWEKRRNSVKTRQADFWEKGVRALRTEIEENWRRSNPCEKVEKA